ncbi:hypothetical protein MBLNU457_g0225t1 [Dothideomycetes sp. NU457]
MQAGGIGHESSHAASDDAAYLFREVISNVPLSAEGDDDGLYITCVEYWDGNLYIGTSGAELLHFVSLPAEEGSESDQPTFILASRLEPSFTTKSDSPYHTPGIQQILILPSVSKACILCNGTLTFYTLPELSPAYRAIKQPDCAWVGGLDRDLEDEGQNGDDTVALLLLRQRLRLIRIGDQARKVRDIELPGCVNVERRGDLACVADGKAYSLLDVVNQQKIDLFPISTAVEAPDRSVSPAEDARPSAARQPSRSFSSRSPIRNRLDPRGHERIASLGSDPRNTDRLRPDSPSKWPARASSRESIGNSPLSTPTRGKSPASDNQDRPLPPPPAEDEAQQSTPEDTRPLVPHIASLTPTEYLLTTGTNYSEPGVGMFVNLDGDVVRGTIEFTTYPESLVLSRGGDSNMPTTPTPNGSTGEGFVLAIVKPRYAQKSVLQIQRWDVDPSEQHASRKIIPLPIPDADASKSQYCVRLKNPLTKSALGVPVVTQALSLRRLHLREPSETDKETDEKRMKDEDRLFSRFATIPVSTLLFAGTSVWWLVQNPLLIQLDTSLNYGFTFVEAEKPVISRDKVESAFNRLRGEEATDELGFLTLNYIRQKASMLMLMDLLLKTADGVIAFEGDKRFTQDALISSDVEPRIVLSIIPGLRYESIEGPGGIWTAGGIQSSIQKFRDSDVLGSITQDARGPYGDNLLQVLKQYLLAWRRKKGFGSIADEQYVFQTVDAALLHVLLLLDQYSPSGPATAGSLRAELNDVVDRGVDCFDRAIALLEQYKRLYLLSRLYQSRKMVAQVLATWRRILEGEHDEGGELVDGENDLRKYLTRIKDVNLVTEYGTWLANRNPKLGVQIFADDSSRVKFSPTEAVDLLKERAPGAVKEYLEYLVFGKNQVQYVNELIAFYLDTVITEISSSTATRDLLTNTYETYRALQPPKPTYRQFIADNAIDADWHRNRLRLLQLIGGSHGAASRYNVDTVAARLEPFSDVLVPEMIILNGRRGQHIEALRLLTHGLGDYDTAIRYCLLGGSSIFDPSSGLLPDDALPSKTQQETLFRHLFNEFMKLDDEAARLERATELLERFGPWFDVGDVLASIPDDWPVDVLAGFIVHALRKLVSERNETVVLKALAGAQNLRRANEVVEKIESCKPVVLDKDEGRGGDSAYASMGSGVDDLGAAVQ